MNTNIVLIDICGTLYDSNTTFDFLDFYIKKRSYIFFRKFSRMLILRLLNKILILLFKLDLTRIIAVRFLKDKTTKELKSAVDLFYLNYLINLKQTKIINIVNQLKLDGKTMILVSATLDFIAKKISEEVKIESFVSTTLHYKDNICLGTIKSDLLFNKLEILKSKSIDPPYFLTITDNISDLDILFHSNNRIVVSKKRNEKKWLKKLEFYNILNCKIISD